MRSKAILSRAPERNGINCVWLDNNTGKPARMSLELRDTSNPGRETRKKDIGTFSQYAGSVRVGDMREHCMQVIATFEGDEWYSDLDWHCDGGILPAPPTPTYTYAV